MYIIRLVYINTYITITATFSRSSGSRQCILLHTHSIIQLNKLTVEDQFSWKREFVLSIFHAAKHCLHALTVAKLTEKMYTNLFQVVNVYRSERTLILLISFVTAFPEDIFHSANPSSSNRQLECRLHA